MLTKLFVIKEIYDLYKINITILNICIHTKKYEKQVWKEQWHCCRTDKLTHINVYWAGALKTST